MTLAEFEALVAAKPAGTPLAEILGVQTIYWSGSLTGHIYLVPDVVGERSAIVPAALKSRFEA